MKRWIQRLAWIAMRRSGAAVELEGAQVLDLGKAPPGPAINSLADGLSVLQNYAKLFHSRVHQACDRYVLFDEASPEYWPLADAIIFGKSELADSNNGEVALALVHEATHARLERLGLSAKRFGLDRIEQACVRRERCAAAMLPNSSQWVAFVDAKASTCWWSADKTARHLERQLAGSNPNRVRAWIAHVVSQWATRNHPAGGDRQSTTRRQ